MEEEQENSQVKDIKVYKDAIHQQELKNLCSVAYRHHNTPLQRINSVIAELKTYDHTLESLYVTREEWLDEPYNKKYKEIARKYNSRVLRDLDFKSKKKSKIFN